LVLLSAAALLSALTGLLVRLLLTWLLLARLLLAGLLIALLAALSALLLTGLVLVLTHVFPHRLLVFLARGQVLPGFYVPKSPGQLGLRFEISFQRRLRCGENN
jgi:hypothetical protein